MTTTAHNTTAAHDVDHATQHREAAKNTVAMLLSRLAVAVMGWSGTVLIARLLSPTDWGVYSFVFGLLGMMSIVTDLQVGRVVLARLLTGDDDERELVSSSFVYLRALLGLVGYAVALGYVAVMGYPARVLWVTALAGLVVVIATPSHALSVLYQSRLKMVKVAVAEAFAQLVQLLLTIAIAFTMPVLLIFILPAIVNEIVAGTWKFVGIRRGWLGLRLNRMPQLRLWKEMLVEAVPLSIGFGIVTLLSKVDVLMLGKLDTFASVGFYSIAYKFADLVAYGVLAVTTPVATLLVAAWPHFTDEFRSRTRAAMVAVALLTTLAAVALWGPAEPVVALLYGERFGEAGNAMRWLLVGAVFSGLTQMVLVVLVAANRQRRYPWIALAALAVNIGLNAALIPRLSYDGAAYATVVTEVVMLAAMWILMVRTVPVRGLMPVGQLAMIAGLGLGVCVVESLVVEFGGVPRAVAAVGAVLVFIALAFALRIADARTLRRLVRS
ncbi:putative colanic acid exporter [Mycolicibacterium phlei]|uniref:Uncharacterized protein n=1 Tax=Mycolicibacterium phlei DSM 43239 = CCUG 21000 TaxID=1226750 RepID=A0A5N5UQ52_MYCPH|nr:flippase [Mycolicibacterium phlei]VEG08179.1 putative colanic acid exporter [Mycobacteroides chelonae]AMO60057.1 colanic acid exporter [Mycolicibacterium phlei]KAB7751721.1 hypothetical protein MPHL21000_23390 [Mycolicibacterium phlei DSM 43239 = CCUG 21000]KXW60306.1 hypothetical protein MPHL43239_25110 [Mycolicibacterium phlei DSM 43239 = CCUG 21000]KXW65937.1 hypothetical protein MPHL43070_21375 [Mycolicibacterium phlei DSM 43070]